MKDLLEALLIFSRYTDAENPTHCVHDELQVLVDPDKVSADHMSRLSELGFQPQWERGGGGGYFYSFRFGNG